MTSMASSYRRAHLLRAACLLRGAIDVADRADIPAHGSSDLLLLHRDTSGRRNATRAAVPAVGCVAAVHVAARWARAAWAALRHALVELALAAALASLAAASTAAAWALAVTLLLEGHLQALGANLRHKWINNEHGVC